MSYLRWNPSPWYVFGTSPAGEPKVEVLAVWHRDEVPEKRPHFSRDDVRRFLVDDSAAVREVPGYAECEPGWRRELRIAMVAWLENVARDRRRP